ncbi:MAG: hypothetical protein U9R05_08610 [Chloroflexota bacterium]|nr:hypothetical protein [Chloroflexota bacterium]
MSNPFSMATLSPPTNSLAGGGNCAASPVGSSTRGNPPPSWASHAAARLPSCNTWRLWPTGDAQGVYHRGSGRYRLDAGTAPILQLARDKRDVGRELRALAKQGFVTKDETTSAGYRIRPQAFLWWLADEMVRTVRDEIPFETWLQKQELGALLTRGEKEQLGQAVRKVGSLLKDGVTTLIEAAAKGAGQAVVKGA